MPDNLYFMEIIYFIFYAFLILFIYLNSVSIYNFSQSNKIIVENSSPHCKADITSLPFLTPSPEFQQCFNDPNKYIYSLEKYNLSFIVSKNQEDAAFFIKICKKYCSDYDNIQSECKSKNKTTYNNCMRLLEPPARCSNNSSAVAIDKEDSKFLYVVSNTGQKTLDNC